MNFKRKLKTIRYVLVSASFLAMLGGIGPACASQGGEAVSAGTIKAASHDRQAGLAPQHAEGNWTCPMHPEVHRHEPGKCPVCKMKLVKARPKNV